MAGMLVRRTHRLAMFAPMNIRHHASLVGFVVGIHVPKGEWQCVKDGSSKPVLGGFTAGAHSFKEASL